MEHAEEGKDSGQSQMNGLEDMMEHLCMAGLRSLDTLPEDIGDPHTVVAGVQHKMWEEKDLVPVTFQGA
jgi:hypothetical protein